MRIYTFILLLISLSFFSQHKEIPKQKVKNNSNIHFYKNKPLQGKYKIYNKREREDYEITNFVNGLRHDSLSFTYYLGATSIGKYANGLKEDIWTSTYRDRKLYEISNYANGKKNGQSIKYNYDRTLQDTLTYKNDKLEGWQIIGDKFGKRKELFENGELKESVEKKYDGNYSSKLKYVKLDFHEYSLGNKTWSNNGKNFSDSITLDYDDEKIERTVYTKLNDSLYHKMQTVKDRMLDKVTINFYDKKNKLYMKYLLPNVSISADDILFEDFFFPTLYDEKTKTLEVRFSNPCKIWEEIGRRDFTVYKYNEANKVSYYTVEWLESDDDMLADFCHPHYKGGN